MLDTEEVVTQIHNAIAAGDNDALWRGLHDLPDAGVTDVEIVMRHITKSGKMVETIVSIPSQKAKIITPISRAEKIIFRLQLIADGNRLGNGEPLRYFKHKNEMSPEEFEWVSGLQ